MASKVTCVTATAVFLALLLMNALFLIKNEKVGETPVPIKAALGKTVVFPYVAEVAALLALILCCCICKFPSSLCIALASLCTLTSLSATVVVIAQLKVILEKILPYVWKVYPKQCHEIPHVETFGHVLHEGCAHECAYSFSALMSAAVKAVKEGTLSSVLSEMTPDATCIDAPNWGSIQKLVDLAPELWKDALMFLLPAAVLLAIAFLGTLFMCCCLEKASARERRSRTHVEPLLKAEPAA
uniref:Transmembrane protein n=1 Tax=Pyrodinium bahamense TaxID=73915 RepID=A0A7S0A1F0_9DINO|mmetsp:Transcript_18409/g.50664  ORF Transcript_18409/g.50664 Transcript_18409/m.50664 type:complete len:242 (+) Transcript_18409:48-773(+)